MKTREGKKTQFRLRSFNRIRTSKASDRRGFIANRFKHSIIRKRVFMLQHNPEYTRKHNYIEI